MRIRSIWLERSVLMAVDVGWSGVELAQALKLRDKILVLLVA